MTAQQAQKWLYDKDLRVIEAQTGVPYATLWRIKAGRVRNLSQRTSAALGEKAR
jgi:hypothetical protein